MTSSIERRLTALEANGIKAASNLTVRFIGEEATPDQEAEHATLRAGGAALLVVQFVAAQPYADPVAVDEHDASASEPITKR